MSFSLLRNFFANARGLTFQDANGVTWSFDKNLNQVKAAVAGASGGTVTSVALADGSTTPITTVSGSPVSVSGTLTYTLKTQNANMIFAGPGTGAAAQPTFRALVEADIPHVFASTLESTVSAGGLSAAYVVQSAGPVYAMQHTSGAADGKIWDWGGGVGSTSWAVRYLNDAQSTALVAIQFTRAGLALTFCDYGNTTDSPTHRFRGPINFNNVCLGNAAASALGYGTGAGGTVTQTGSRATGVTLNKITGAITLLSAAGTAAFTTFTVTNSTVVALDTIVLSVKSGTNVYLAWVTAVGAGSFNITFQTTGGTATDSPVINFAVIKAVAS
jgi:hypothetical protein